MKRKRAIKSSRARLVLRFLESERSHHAVRTLAKRLGVTYGSLKVAIDQLTYMDTRLAEDDNGRVFLLE